jgi:hypothetical protein
MGLLDVPEQVLAPAGVVQPDDGRAGERGTAEREQVLGHVVEQDRDVRRPALGQALEEQVRPPAGPGVVLAVGPDPVREPDRRAVDDVAVGGVAPQQRRGVGRRQRRLPRRRRAPPRS